MKLSNMADYAVVIMSHLAQGGAERHAASEIVEATGVPAAAAAKLLGALAREGLLVSQRGIAGGFALARPAGEISVADIIEAVDGPIALTNCLGEHAGDCSLESICATRPHWHAINGAVRAALAQVSLAEMALPNMAFLPDADADLLQAEKE
ncbi:MAG: SUF system Fe-S cluster assembly regulator [Alphaproteobacteria bacterium]|nr:MAG: SUF system Fe-S cluster assembly regulator [Alphaproteobacteria bacterium]